MASGIFAILDDIGALLDDVATASKVATGKTAGILGDDLAVNAEKATGFVSSRELPVLWAITKGSFINKLIIVPIALLLNAFFPAVINYVLMLGGAYLAYEGVEKIVEYFFHKNHHHEDAPKEEVSESAKIKSAIATDFILSIEIVIIALGSVLGADLITQILAVCVVSILATVGVYGIVALIVRMDDAGFSLMKKSPNKGSLYRIGNILVHSLPVVIKILGVVGTIALLLVAGGIFVHSMEFLHHLLPQLPGMIKDFGVGLVVGSIVLIIVTIVNKIKKAFA
ncbi:DUF808 domain-containing protein [Elizabethkingia sp. JS20170427COW]|uniref:DUF808 domain-containing protein n=1 Tax=Elizabethkingia sp. JS20170427COW TaxID=2583851 RepID=UPI00111048DF|nr:DUF808 domain-containing protein [Elizabethkingia sp. JS20170427COW]QCX53823.1 DUF808 domain-containing protein [Elizabethkingia sp. JS20170427COW]